MRSVASSGSMDVVNGKIVEAVRAAGGTTPTSGPREASGVMATDRDHAWSALKPSKGFVSEVGASDEQSSAAEQEGAESFGQRGAQEWAPSSAPSGSWYENDTMATTTTTAATSPGIHGSWNDRQLGPEKSGRAGDFTGLRQAALEPDHRQPGWNRSGSTGSAGGSCAMDVEGGQFAEFARTGSKPLDQALGLKPSRARVVEPGSSRRAEFGSHGKSEVPGSFVRAPVAGEWAPSWAPSWVGMSNSSDEPMATPWGCSGHGLAPAPARLISESRPRAHGFPGFQQHRQHQHQQAMQPDHRQGWKRTHHTGPSTSPPWSADQRHYHFDRSPCTEGKLDEELTLYESQIIRTVSSRFPNLTSLVQEISSSPMQSTSADPSGKANHDGELPPSSPVSSKSTELLSSYVLKRKRSGLADGDVQAECRWIQPLKLLVRKGLTLSDVGELGRIIVPKKDAESQSFPQIDTKEGTVLEMEDYTASKRWYFRFKYWINNKSRSRMYVLENTGEFIKYHSLKEHDIFLVYEDGCKKLVVCGHKKGGDNTPDLMLELPNGFIVDSSASPPAAAAARRSDKRLAWRESSSPSTSTMSPGPES